MAALTTSQRISSLVFVDFESTGIPTYEFQPRATEICLIAVERDHFQSFDETEQEVRIQNKLRLCFYPRKRISQNSTHLTGLGNENLQNQKPLNEDFVEALIAFLKRLPVPICLIAHNGYNFDFPLLQAEIRNLGCSLPEHLLCADSYCAFRSILEGLSTRTAFLSAPLEILPAMKLREEVTDVNDEQQNISDEESDWLDEELLSQQKCTYESLGFAVEYDDISSDEENGGTLCKATNSLKCAVVVSDVKPRVSARGIDGVGSEPILLDCDNPNCQCSDCSSVKGNQTFTQKLLCSDIEDILNANVTDLTAVSENGGSKYVNGLDNKTTQNEQNLNGRNPQRPSVIVSVPPVGVSTEAVTCSDPLNSEEYLHDSSKSNKLNLNIETAPNDTDLKAQDVEAAALLEDDIEFVVNFLLTPEFQKLEGDAEIAFSKSQSDKTPKQATADPNSLTRQSHKCAAQDCRSLNRVGTPQETSEESFPKADPVRKRLFPEEQPCNKSLVRMAVKAADDAFNQPDSVTPTSLNTQASSVKNQVTVCTSPPKRLCNGGGINGIERRLDKNAISLSNELFSVNKEAAASAAGTASQQPILEVAKQVGVGEMTAVQPILESASCSEGAKSMHLTQSTQNDVQTQRAKHKYGLEPLHQLLVGTKPAVSHTAEDDTVALMRMCRARRNEFCDWVDKHAVPLNRVPPMWPKKYPLTKK